MTATIETATATATVDSIDFKDALAKFVGVVPARKTPAILMGNIQVRALREEKALVLCATDLESALRLWIPADVDADTSMIVDFKALKIAAGAVPSDKAVLTFAPDAIVVSSLPATTSGRAPTGGAVEDYPTFPHPYATPEEAKIHATPMAVLSIPPAEFARGLRAVLPGIAKGDTRYALNGVCLSRAKSGEGIELCTSNTHVLYCYTVQGVAGETLPAPNNRDGDSVIITESAAAWLSKHIPADAVKRLEVRVTKHEVYFECSAWRFIARRIDGRFPNYWDVIPDRVPGQLTVNRKDFLAVLKQAKPAADPDKGGVDVIPAGESITVQTRQGDAITFSASIPAASRKCPAATFNVFFLADFLSVASSEILTFRFGNDIEGPAVACDGNLVFVVMPFYTGKSCEDQKAALAAYRATLAEPDQDYPGATTTSAPVVTKKAPSYKAVVAAAKADPRYLSALLSALGIQAATV